MFWNSTNLTCEGNLCLFHCLECPVNCSSCNYNNISLSNECTACAAGYEMMNNSTINDTYC